MYTKIILLSILAGLFGRMGGAGQEGRDAFPWLPGWAFDSKVRDAGIPLLMLFCLPWDWALIFCFGLMFASQTTYFKRKGTDARWFNWLFVGLAYSLCMFPYSLAIGNLHGFILRSVVVIFTVVLVSEVSGDVTVEEGFRGAVQIATLPLLLI